MLTVVKTVLLAAVFAVLLWLLVRLVKGGNVSRVFFGSACMGLLAFAAVSITGAVSHQPILQLNPYTLGTASVLGVPGVILMVIVKMIWQL